MQGLPNESDKYASPDNDWQLFIESVEDYALFMLDVGGHVRTWNRGAQKIKGYAPEEIIGRHFSTFYPEEDAAEKPARELVEALANGRVEDEGWRIRKDGSRFWANVVITTLRDQHGEVRGFAKVTRDLTARLQQEETLRRSEERFRLLVETVQDYAIFMLDPHGCISTWNRGAQAIKGYQASEIIGKHFSSFYTAEDIAAGKPAWELEVAIEQGRVEDEGWRVRKDGSMFWASVVITALRDPRGELVGFAKVTRDLTARANAERIARELVREQTARAAAEEAEARVRAAAELAERAAKQAEEASRLKDEFLATVSHELRTPLNAIVGWSSLLRSRTADGSVLKGLEVIHRNAVAQGRIIEDILDVSRIITGKLRLDLAPTSLVKVVQDSLDVIRPAALARDIRLTFTAPDAECWLVADAERLQQVVWNLLSNAVKFGKKGGAIELAVEAVNSSYALTVRDDGQGIAPEFLPFVFDRFKQADSSATRRVGGLGLGLALVRHLVELHGGKAQVASEGAGRGTTFTIRLPIRAVALPRQPNTDAASADGSANDGGAALETGMLQGKRVLVVDDEEDARELLRTLLSAAGAEVELAGSAAEGYLAFQRFRPDVLVSDVGMPEEDGYAFMNRVRAFEPTLGSHVPALALTAYARAQDRAAALAAGFTTHLGKPVEPDALLQAVVELARSTEARGRPKPSPR